MKKYILIIILIFTANIVFATNVTVNNYTALVNAVNGTTDTIYIDGTIVISAQITVNHDIVFIGINNATLDGNNNGTGILTIEINRSVYIDSIKFINGSGWSGVAITNQGVSLIIKNSAFINNVSNGTVGGAIRADGYQGTYIEIENTLFDSNRNIAGFDNSKGGAMYLDSYLTTCILKNCLFFNNIARAHGGAIYSESHSYFPLRNWGKLIIINCSFNNNTAYWGSALSCQILEMVTIFNSEFYNNHSSMSINDYGCAILLNYNNSYIINSTIVKNTGGGISLFQRHNLNIYNSIIAGNTNDNGVNDITKDNREGVSTLNMYNCAYENITETINTNQNNFSGVAPTSLFADYDANDFRLICGSVAFDGGNNNYYVNQWNNAFPTNTITTPAAHYDIAGNIRLSGSQINMGAYEKGTYIKNIVEAICDDENYNFYGRILNTAGTYTDTIAGVECDTIAILHLTVGCIKINLLPIPDICADNSEFNIDFEIIEGVVEKVSVIFNEKAHTAGFVDIINQNISNQEFSIPLPANVRPDNYSAKIIFSGGGLTKEIPIDFTVLYPSSVIVQKWNDVLALLNERYNGGYIWSSYQWYKNGEQIAGENISYLYVGANGDELDFTAEYRAKITRVDDGVTLFTCGFSPAYNSNAYLTLRPTIVSPNQPITIITEDGRRATFWNVLGINIGEYPLSNGTNTINAPAVAGTYILSIENQNSERRNEKIVVK